MERWCRLTRFLFWINVAILAALAWEYQAIRRAAFSPGILVGKDLGLDASMTSVSAAIGGCTLLRSVSADCAACVRDDAQFWPSVRDAVSARGCPVYTVDVGIGNSQRTGARIRFPSTRLASTGLLDKTPTVLLLDAEGRVIWRRIGILEKSDAAAILNAKRGGP
jgi:hypothetical protein